MNNDTQDTQPSADSVSAQHPLTSKRLAPTKVLPSDRLAFEKQERALRAYAGAYATNGGKPVTNEAAGAIIGISANTIVVTNAFFADLGFLTRQKEAEGLLPSNEVIEYAQSYEWDKEAAKGKLKPILEHAWFGVALIPRLKFRPYEIAEALAVLAEAASANKDYEGRIKCLLEYMVYFGVVAREGNQIKAASISAPISAQTNQPAQQLPVPAQPPIASSPVLEDGMEQYTLILDAQTKRKVIVQAPHSIKDTELERIRQWLGFQLIIEKEKTDK